MPYLEALTTSLLTQTYEPLSIIFSDGGSSDSSLAYVNGIDDPRVRVLQQPPGTGAAGNWTAASGAATGEFTKLICQDDLLYPEAIAQQVADLQANPSAVMAIARRDIVDARGRVISRDRGLAGLRAGRCAGDRVLRQCYLKGTNVIGEPLAVLFRTEALRSALPWVDDNPLMLDLAMYAKVASGAEVVLHETSIGAFRVSGSSWSTRLASQQAAQTRAWQQDYQDAATAAISATERFRAAIGRHLQTGQRRSAYAFLRATGRLSDRP